MDLIYKKAMPEDIDILTEMELPEKMQGVV